MNGNLTYIFMLGMAGLVFGRLPGNLSGFYFICWFLSKVITV